MLIVQNAHQNHDPDYQEEDENGNMMMGGNNGDYQIDGGASTGTDQYQFYDDGTTNSYHP